MLAYSKQLISYVKEELVLATCYEDIIQNDKQGKMSAILTIEEGGILNGDLSRLEELHRHGVRLITLTGNHENCIGFPNKQEGGLKSFGFDVIGKMNELGIIVDVSHLSDAGFWDVLKCSQKPVVASHSNARTLCNHPRNLSDEMIRALAKQGGVIGVNAYPYFLHSSGKASMELMADHMAHIYHVGGEDVLGFGTDFDGYDDGVSDFCNISQMNMFYELLVKRGFTERQIEKFCFKNILRVLKS